MEMPMNRFAARMVSRALPMLAAAALLCLPSRPSLAAEAAGPLPQGMAVTVLKAQKSCFADIVEASGIIQPRERTVVRPERFGARVTDILAEPGESVTAGQTLARLKLPEGGTAQVNAPVAGIVLNSSAVIGALASAKGEALFTIIARGEFDLIGLVPTEDIGKLKPDQTARIKIIGAGEFDGKVSRVAPTVEPDIQLGQVTIAINSNPRLLVNSSGRAMIKTGESCGVSVPLTAVLYTNAGTVVQVVRRDRVETRRVEVGLMSGAQVEIRDGLTEGDMVVARAGALLREGDQVRPVLASADGK
ncbi:MAG TPA: HlyD family efflux transporter periplasmic adaptor subunit [Bradyrhizobium sp.]|nr:HlyD family efflux transporter periplasmic adaptor subunit [Bradyrhizobium sp.]